MSAASDIERLIELGLNRYGAGDLDGAILMWEEALAIDPDNAQATSYLDYARDHYDLLTSSEPSLAPGDEPPFGIEEEPEYQIEITPGELPAAEEQAAASEAGPVDDGWFDDAVPPETDDESSRPIAQFEEEVTLAPTIEAREPDEEEQEPVNFEGDATREYYTAHKNGLPLMPPKSDFADTATGEWQNDERSDESAGFRHESTPLGFGSMQTEIRKRDFGFVTPVAEDTKDRTEGAPTLERHPFGKDFAPESTEDDLLATKPRLRPPPGAQPPPNQAMIETQEIPGLHPKGTGSPDSSPVRDKIATTRDYPSEQRLPARRDSAELSQAEVVLTHAKTRQFDGSVDIGAPTRDLGLRTKPPVAPQLSNPDDEEVPTREADVRAIRDAAGTKTDIVLPFDPIDARSQQILAEVDASAPADEPKDDQTRRRIGALVERAAAFAEAGDLDKAVTAADLAMSEDPNSALGQKLITRNRDQIMNVFQAFVGNLERMPQLTKPLHELQNAPISPRAAFLLSRVDGTLTIDELLDVSGMPRMEAYRYLCQLFLRGILR